MAVRILAVFLVLAAWFGCRSFLGDGKTAQISRIAIQAQVSGDDVPLTEDEVASTMRSYLAERNISVVEEFPELPATEETPPILILTIQTGPRICWEFYGDDTGTCDRLGIQFLEPARLIRSPNLIVMAPTVHFSGGSSYRQTPETYQSELQPDRLRERVVEQLDILFEKALVSW